MKILLAGYNVDADVLDSLKGASPARDDVTPETLSAAYARISRDPRPVDALRAAARSEVERARRSNRAIIFAMGHHSVAEHAVFNFDLIGVSRLAIESIERFRLCSFTEKSQRYIALGDDFVVPEEVRDAGREAAFTETVRAQNALYHRLFARLRPHVFARHPECAADPRNHAVLEGWAKEDARYAVSLATEGQLGMTVNARNLEHMIRRLGGHPLAEVRAIIRRLHDLARDVAPSIILFTEPSAFDMETPKDLAGLAERGFGTSGADDSGEEPRRAGAGRARRPDAGPGGPSSRRGTPRRPGRGHGRTIPPVTLAARTEDGDLRILAALLHSSADLSYAEASARAAAMSARGRKAWFRTALERMEFFDAPSREFEHAGLVFDLVVSASCFAQLKRHRMATLTVRPYDPRLGVTVPDSIRETGMEEEFRELIGRTEEIHARLKADAGPAADYVLTNAHRRRALLGLNIRELYHFARLREDATAQWDIRRVAAAMSAAARKALPLSGMLLGGKDAYPEMYEKIFRRRPKQVPPALLK